MEVMETDIKKGFVDLVFSIYENLPREACDALEAMGVLRPGVDRYSIERIARNYLNTFQSTLSNADNKWENEMSEKEKRETTGPKVGGNRWKGGRGPGNEEGLRKA